MVPRLPKGGFSTGTPTTTPARRASCSLSAGVVGHGIFSMRATHPQPAVRPLRQHLRVGDPRVWRHGVGSRFCALAHQVGQEVLPMVNVVSM